MANPDVTNANVQTNGRDTSYNGIQLVLTRRFSKGLQLNANYSYGVGQPEHVLLVAQAVRRGTQMTYTQLGTAAGGPVNHMFVTNWVYELPFGQGKPFGEQRRAAACSA